MNLVAAPAPVKPAGFVSNWQAAGWGFGTLATSTMLNAPTAALLFFLVTVIKLDPLAVGALIFAGKIIDVLTDPPIGALSDKTSSRFGRRRPWLLGSSFACGVAFALLFNIPDVGVTATYLYMFVVLTLFAITYTSFQVPYMAMPTEMTDDYHQRTKIMSWRVVFMSFGNVAGAGAFAALASQLGGGRAGYGEAAVYFGFMIALAMFATFFFTGSSRQTTVTPGQDKISIRQHMVWLLMNKQLMILMGTKISIYLGVFASLTTALFFFKSILKLDETVFFMVFGAQMATTILCMPACNWLAKRIGKKPAYVGSLIGFCLVVGTWLLASANEPTPLLLARAILLGAFGAGAHLYGQSMLIDTFALDYQLTGQRREGVLAASFSFVEKICMALAPFIVGFLLSMLGFNKELDPTADQTASAVKAIYIGFVGIPIVCQIASIVLLRFYHLAEADLQQPAQAGS
ncbi:MAG: MFS transporter [Gammaproteobacteria bacterium]|nr:MFS transporter [Gammaproteobacteria bacterium]MCP4090730.1 MFS transporter [Gammaproteobacteria bacterium]MCP4277157.1 MFS transporter [Gammaproteobacteria bacterium]MCP4831709.1 MFS transporter [Gammaproteobacteria bacterium]MCP4928033.1 MFS transporter [Gammaproteobacteria bacterium]